MELPFSLDLQAKQILKLRYGDKNRIAEVHLDNLQNLSHYFQTIQNH